MRHVLYLVSWELQWKNGHYCNSSLCCDLNQIRTWLSLGLSQPTAGYLHRVHWLSNETPSSVTLQNCLCSIFIFISEKLHHYDKDKFIFWWEKYHSTQVVSGNYCSHSLWAPIASGFIYLFLLYYFDFLLTHSEVSVHLPTHPRLCQYLCLCLCLSVLLHSNYIILVKTIYVPSSSTANPTCCKLFIFIFLLPS
jgi:hypothetical protein